jgi:hypothetical protein
MPDSAVETPNNYESSEWMWVNRRRYSDEPSPGAIRANFC